LEEKDLSNSSRQTRIFLICNDKMKWRIVKCFYIQMRQHLTFSVLTDGIGTFVRNMIKEIFHGKLNKDLIRGRSKKDGAKTS
jgi:hypothetical protein